MLTEIGIVSVGSYLPSRVVPNAVLERELGLEPGWIFRKTGIRARRRAAGDESTADLATAAAERALAYADLEPQQLDLVVVATSSPDWIQPATACAVQHRLGAHRAAAFDLGAVCSGFVYALGIVSNVLRANTGFRTAIVVAAETYSRILDYRDRSTCVLFGDGAGAVVLGPVPEGEGVLSFALGADGSKADLVQIPAGGARRPATDETVAAREHYFRMDGRAVRRYVRENFAVAAQTALDRAGSSFDEIDLVVPHQANRVMLDECARPLRIPPERFRFTIEKYGNTAAASIPITLDDAITRRRARPLDTALLIAFGGGMTWASCVTRLPRRLWSHERAERHEPALAHS
jgi:3-oxoacyl-[acyl-carrier-protein] synthase-3